MKLEYMSDNLIVILFQLLNNQNLCKLISYDSKSPLDELDLSLPMTDLLFTKMFPDFFNPDIVVDDCTQIYIHYPRGEFSDAGVVNITDIYIDIIEARNLRYINIDDVPKVRSLEIMKEIVNTFQQKSIGTLGELHFKGFIELVGNKQFNVLRLITDMTLFG
jgi:hypothetical protein